MSGGYTVCRVGELDVEGISFTPLGDSLFSDVFVFIALGGVGVTLGGLHVSISTGLYKKALEISYLLIISSLAWNISCLTAVLNAFSAVDLKSIRVGDRGLRRLLATNRAR